MDKIPPMVSNTTMKKRAIYTLTLDYTGASYHPEHKPAVRKTSWVRMTHREAMKKVRYAQEHGDVDGSPLKRWQLDSGWQNAEDLIR